MGMFDEFKEKVSDEEMKKINEMLEKEKENSTTYKEVPTGKYYVDVDKMECGVSNWGSDQINIVFTIADGEFKKQKLFYNGTFDDNFAHGILQTAKLIDSMTTGEIGLAVIHKHLEEDKKEDLNDWLMDLAEVLQDLSFDLNYKVTASKKLNPNTGKPYINKFYSIPEDGVYIN